MAKNEEFPKKGCRVTDILKFLRKQGYNTRENGSSHTIAYKEGKQSLSIPTGHGNELSPGTWRNLYKDYNGIDH